MAPYAHRCHWLVSVVGPGLASSAREWMYGGNVSVYQLPFCASPSIYTPTRHHVELVGGSSEYIGGEHRKKGDSMSTTFRPAWNNLLGVIYRYGASL